MSFYFEPDLCAGSFRNTPLFEEIRGRSDENDFIHVITTLPNRYRTFQVAAQREEKGDNYVINRIAIPEHKNGMLDQAKSFSVFYREAMKLVKGQEYDLVYASSSRLFTAFLGRRIAAGKHIPLYLDIRDIFVDTMKDVLGRKKLIQVPVVLFAKLIERYTFSRADHINLVSEGFKDYFSKFQHPTYSFFTNGIDDVFLSIDTKGTRSEQNPMIITYAGNMGSGQGLEKIIPQAAKQLGNKYLFRLIGDGGTKSLLQQKLDELQVHNVELIDPISRKELLEYYRQSTFLFLHLNDLEAFKKVLPSKLFEYGVFDKPVIAGVSGYAAKFVAENLPNHILFSPTNVGEFVDKLRNYTLSFVERSEFRKKFSRKKIMHEMAHDILKFK
ncbi:glycosyltransferase family 4 protein [Bacteroides nordii]|uniref:glycosyltransferase family 4 protein n=1 Tax=Bacteroides nordii TaxID=291645 RepID=UPI0002DCEBBE|nr:glycosyltransferase family 4 protein [Bacteroides nordii]MCG4769669.1 glycosyltransferase family 4 protein [Bacteroides nordii]